MMTGAPPHNGSDPRLIEYQAANAAFMHYDNSPWQVGGLLIGGTIVFWGLLLTGGPTGPGVMFGSVLVTLLLSMWLFYAHHNRALYMGKLIRLWEIETELGLEQHIRFNVEVGDKPMHLRPGERGYALIRRFYAIASVGGPLVGIAQAGYDTRSLLYSALALVIVIAIVCSMLNRVQRQEDDMQACIETERKRIFKPGAA